MTPPAPTIESYAIGTELSLGQIQDTNSSWIGQEVARLGGTLRRLTILVDDLDEIAGALRESVERRTDVILVIGGLGPTPDDLTVEAICQLAGCGTTIDEATVERYMQRRSYQSRDELSPGQRKMASVAEGSEVLPNPEGWAPCMKLCHEGSTLITLPGPPKEMKAVFRAHIAPFLDSLFATKTATCRVWTEMYESEVSPHMQQVMSEFPGTYLKGYVALRSEEHHAMPLDVVAHGSSDEEAAQNLEAATGRIEELILGAGKTFSREQ